MATSNISGAGRVLWLTGASGGLGPGIAKRLAGAGYRLGLHAGSNVDKVRKLAASLTSSGTEVAVTSGNLADESVAANSLSAVRELLGDPWGVVHLAGPYHHADVIDHSREDFDAMIEGNVTTLFEVLRATVPVMRAQGAGRIVAAGMVGAHQTLPMRHNGPHLAAKAAVTSLIRTLALEEATHGITANVISPGHIPHKELDRVEARAKAAGPSHPMGMHGSYEDLAEAILFLLSESASYITGAVLEVTGGWMGEDVVPHKHG